jgi:hypothetical protein
MDESAEVGLTRPASNLIDKGTDVIASHGRLALVNLALDLLKVFD